MVKVLTKYYDPLDLTAKDMAAIPEFGTGDNVDYVAEIIEDQWEMLTKMLGMIDKADNLDLLRVMYHPFELLRIYHETIRAKEVRKALNKALRRKSKIVVVYDSFGVGRLMTVICSHRNGLRCVNSHNDSAIYKEWAEDRVRVVACTTKMLEYFDFKEADLVIMVSCLWTHQRAWKVLKNIGANTSVHIPAISAKNKEEWLLFWALDRIEADLVKRCQMASQYNVRDSRYD